MFNTEVLITAALGFASGMLAPMFVERWKGKRKELIKIISIESEINSLKVGFSQISAVEERVRSLEISNAEADLLREQLKELSSLSDRIRDMEINIVRNSAVLEMQMSDNKNDIAEISKAS